MSGTISGDRCAVVRPWNNWQGQLTDVCTGTGANGIPDDWEYRHFGGGDPTDTDFDDDCAFNATEWTYGTDPAGLATILNNWPNAIYTPGQQATLSVISTAPCAPIQWTKNGSPYPFNGSTLSWSSLTSADDGLYYARLFTPFNYYISDSRFAYLTVLTDLEYVGWEYFINHTNGRSIQLFTEPHLHPVDFPSSAPTHTRSASSFISGYRGRNAFSLCGDNACIWIPQLGVYVNQNRVTAVTRRHGLARGHGSSVQGWLNKYVFFYDLNDTSQRVKVIDAIVRYGDGLDYAVLLFDADLENIEPMWVTLAPPALSNYHPYYYTCQHDLVFAHYPGLDNSSFEHPIHGGDSGNPLMLPSPSDGGRLLLFQLLDCSSVNVQMQDDIEALCSRQNPPLPVENYRLMKVGVPW